MLRDKKSIDQNACMCPDQVAQLVGALSRTPIGCGFDPWSRHIWGNQSMFLSFSFFFPLSIKAINISSGEDVKKPKSKVPVCDIYPT